MNSSPSAPCPEVAFLLRCVAVSDDSPIEELERMAVRVTDWSRVLSLASLHGVVPVVARRVARITPGIVPADTIASLLLAARRGAGRSLQLASRLVSIVQEFTSRGIDALPIKGPTLATLAYGDLSLRPYEDLDVLVRMVDFDRAKSVLVELGFAQKNVFNDARDSLLLGSHHETFIETVSSIPFELHSSLLHRTLVYQSLEDRWWEGPQSVDIGGTSLHTLGPERLVLYLSIHAAKHSWGRIGWLSDLHRCLLRLRDLDWGLIWRLALESHTTRMVGVGLILITELFGEPDLTSAAFVIRPPDRLTREIAARIRNRLLYSPEQIPDLDFALQLRLRTRMVDRARFALHVLAEPWPADVLALKMPMGLRGAYYAFRPLRLVWTHVLSRTLRRE